MVGYGKKIMPTKKYRIVVASSAYPPSIMGGGEISTQKLCELLASYGHQVVSVSFSDVEQSEIVAGVKVVRLVPKRGYSLFYAKGKSLYDKVQWRIREEYSNLLAQQVLDVAIQENADCLVTSTIEDVSTYLWPLAKTQGIKTIHILRSFYLLCWSGTMYKKGKNCERQCILCKASNVNKIKNSQFVDTVVGISRSVLDIHLASGAFATSMQNVIPNICFENGESNVRKTYSGCDFAPIVMGYIGRIHPTKGIEDIIQGIYTSGRCNDIKLVVAGSGDEAYLEKLKAMAIYLKVEFNYMGHMTQEAFFNAVDVITVPSKWREPFGRVVVEAFSFGVPVIARGVGGMPEIVTPTSGYLYSDIDELVEIYKSLNLSKLSKLNFEGIDKYMPKAIYNEWKLLLEGLMLPV